MRWRWRIPTEADYQAVAYRKAEEKSAAASRERFNARDDVVLARKIAAMCNGDVLNNSTCELLALGTEKLRRMVAIIAE